MSTSKLTILTGALCVLVLVNRLAAPTVQSQVANRDAPRIHMLLQSEKGHYSLFGFSPDSRLIAYSHVLRGKTEKPAILVHDLVKAREVYRISTLEFASAAVFARDGKTLLVGYSHKGLCLFDLATGNEILKFEHDPNADCAWSGQPLAFSRDGKLLIVAGSRLEETAAAKIVGPAEVQVWDVATGKKLRQFGRKQYGNVVGFVLDDTGQFVVAEHAVQVRFQKKGKETINVTKNSLQLWEIASGKHVGQVGQALEGNWHRYMLVQLRDFAPECRIRISPLGKVMIFPRFQPARVLRVSRQETGVLSLTDFLSGKELHRFREFESTSPTGFGLSADHKTFFAHGFRGLGAGESTLVVYAVAHWQDKALWPELPQSKLEVLWEKLATSQPLEAYRAACQLSLSAKHVIPFLREQLRPIPDETGKIKVLMAQLNDKQFAVRQNAQEALLSLGEQGAVIIQEALKGTVPLEARERMGAVLQKFRDRQPDEQTRRVLWSVEILEQLATPEARALLLSVSRGCRNAWLTREAKASLDRLK